MRRRVSKGSIARVWRSLLLLGLIALCGAQRAESMVTPVAPPPASIAPVLLLPAPTGLTSTTDSKVCGTHGGLGGGLACQAGLPKGMLALVWNFCSTCKADGYHLYRVDGGQHTSVPIPANGTQVSMALLDVPTGGFGGKCYAVTAYRGTQESAPSARFCVGQVPAAWTSVFLKPSYVAGLMRGRKSSSSQTYSSIEAQAIVGFLHSQAFHGPWSNEQYETNIIFDPGPLNAIEAQTGPVVIKAMKLHLHVAKSWISDPPGSLFTREDDQTSCAATFGLGAGRQLTGDWLSMTSLGTFGPNQGPDVSIDLWPMLQNGPHVLGGNPYGFILMGEDPNPSLASDNPKWLPSSCKTQYADTMTLEVVYTP
jgi:hypothetical protein